MEAVLTHPCEPGPGARTGTDMTVATQPMREAGLGDLPIGPEGPMTSAERGTWSNRPSALRRDGPGMRSIAWPLAKAFARLGAGGEGASGSPIRGGTPRIACGWKWSATAGLLRSGVVLLQSTFGLILVFFVFVLVQ